MANHVTVINKYKLYEEWERQSALYEEWGQACAKAEADLDDANIELELVEAEVASSIRKEPDRFGLIKSKLSETMIDKILPLQAEVQDAQREVNRLKRLVGSLKVTVKAVDQKRVAMENMVKLQIGGFYAEPKAPRGMQDKIKEREDRKFGVGIPAKKKRDT